MNVAKVTCGSEDLPIEDILLNIAVKAKVNQAKKDCSPEVLEPLATATIEAKTGLNDKWTRNEETKRKLSDLDVKFTKLIQDRIQINVNAGLLSEDCTEKMTNIETAPAEEPLSVQSVEPETAKKPALETPTPVPEETSVPKSETIEPLPTLRILSLKKYQLQRHSRWSLKPHLVFAPRAKMQGCKDTKFVLEKKFKSRPGKFYEQEIPTECEKKLKSFVGIVLDLLNLSVEADVDVKTNASG
ncbi:hypothetical protein BGX21_006205 [Mortierella sp. AD011]|nr:hypothetical protein BGX20_006187 [Mortierella sp. AD010]KAF9369007.1 hypothetical protein BGX21_006205 [Mortierella sp. AD011]